MAPAAGTSASIACPSHAMLLLISEPEKSGKFPENSEQIRKKEAERRRKAENMRFINSLFRNAHKSLSSFSRAGRQKGADYGTLRIRQEKTAAGRDAGHSTATAVGGHVPAEARPGSG